MWTSRDEAEITCDGPLGPVKDTENVARLLVAMNPPQGWRAFRRTDFERSSNAQPSNVCGDSDGCSVDRSSDLTREELQARSEAFAAVAQAAAEARKPQKITRTGGGARVASVEELRAVATRGLSGQKVVYIYADPRPKNKEHAVIRVVEGVAEEEWPILLDDISGLFR